MMTSKFDHDRVIELRGLFDGYSYSRNARARPLNQSSSVSMTMTKKKNVMQLMAHTLASDVTHGIRSTHPHTVCEPSLLTYPQSFREEFRRYFPIVCSRNHPNTLFMIGHCNKSAS